MNWKKRLERFDRWCGRIADRTPIMDLVLFVLSMYLLIYFICKSFK